MPVEMAIWKMTATGPVPVETSALDLESKLEDMLVGDPSLVGLDILPIGRQVQTGYGGFVDVLGVDVEGRLHVLELKRDRTPREVVAQTLDYASWADDLTLVEVRELYAAHHGADFDAAFAERFGVPVPDAFNVDHELTIVASALDPASERIVRYLATRYEVPVNAVFFRHFRDRDAQYLARSWLIDPTEAETTPRVAKKVRPWNGRDFFVTLGRVDYHNRWDVCRKYGIVCAGGGARWWRPLRNLQPGHRVFAYVGGAGYVGIGEVTHPMQKFAELTVNQDGREVRVVEQDDVPDFLREHALSEDPESSEYAVKVRWLKTVPLDEAFSAPGLFAVPISACRLRDERTISEVATHFDVTE